MADIFDKTLNTLLSGRDGLRSISTKASERPLGAQRACPRCGDTVTWVEYVARSSGRALRYWTECSCVVGASERAEALSAASTALHAEYRNEDARHELPASLQHFTLASFDSHRLTGGDRLVAAARRWLEQITPHSVAPSYHADPRACLYFYSAGKGHGKTHMAAALLNEARGRAVAFADEIGYIEAYWSAALEEKARLSAWPAERAWLTVLDDLGQRERTSDTLRDAWYDVVNPRWLKRGWTIITSNWTPAELLSRGTINEATYSRIIQMTRGQLVTFNGRDQRLPGGGGK